MCVLYTVTPVVSLNTPEEYCSNCSVTATVQAMEPRATSSAIIFCSPAT